MGIYAITGAASGIGRATAQQLALAGHEIITLDIRNADIECDLSNAQQVAAAIAAVIERAPGGLDGFVPCAGVGPDFRNKALISAINYFAVVDMVNGLLPSIKKNQGAIVLVSSNSAQMMEYDEAFMQALLNDERQQAASMAEGLDGQAIYGGAKQALARWMRQNNPLFAGSGIRINAIAPGYTQTGMTESGLKDPDFKESIEQFVNTIPLGRRGEPADQANVISFLLSEKASFISGVVLFTDGGHDALFRPHRF
jgi:NAD(P)-dependent dehydrogenase (short-subunit alcohol dehydrogenase family)